MVDQARENECSVTVAPAQSACSTPLAFQLADLPEVLLDQAHGHAALSHRGRDPLDRIGPNVADREHAGQAGLQQVRTSAQSLYRFRTRRRCCDLRFGRMSRLRQDRGLCLFACST